MLSKPNYKARLNRANRNNVPVYSVFESFKRIKFFALFLIIIFPIYPSFAVIGTTTETSIGDYDVSSIITSFVDTESLEYISDNGLVTGGDINYNSGSSEFSEEKTNIQNINQEIPKSNIKTYTVVEYDDIIKISKRYGVSAEVILWSNNLSMNDTLKVGQVLRIPEKTGLVHVLTRGETISSLAKKYNVSVSEILEYNDISDVKRIKDGTKLMIPGVVKKETPVVAPKKVETTTKKQTTTSTNKTQTQTQTQTNVATVATKQTEAPVTYDNGLKSRYEIKFTGLGRGFVPGNCTWHVARNKTVTWRGNANQWIKNARAKGIPTGKTPIIGAIVQFSGYGYNSYYGHVGIVTDVTDTHIIVSDMNYAGLYKVTIRQVSKNDPAIDGYIYVD